MSEINSPPDSGNGKSLALEQANSPVLMGLARGAAKDAIRQNLAIPLAVAGFDNVTVTVRFDEEKETP